MNLNRTTNQHAEVLDAAGSDSYESMDQDQSVNQEVGQPANSDKVTNKSINHNVHYSAGNQLPKAKLLL